MIEIIQSAFASEATSLAQQSSTIMSLMPLLLITLVFYFLLIRPQQKKMKAHHAMIDSVSKGDKIVTAGGILASVIKVEQENGLLIAEIAPDVRIKIKRETVSEVLRATPKEKAA